MATKRTTTTRRPTAKKRPAAKRPAARKPAPRRTAPVPLRHRLPVFEQRHYDVLGLGLFAVAVFLAFPMYFGWDAGAGGAALIDALTWIAGRVAYTAPVAIGAVGIVLVLRPVLPAVRPLRAGALCLLLAACLGFAAGTLGLGPEIARHGGWEPAYFSARGGALGDALFVVSSNVIGAVGTHILTVFLFLAGVVLLTGASIAGVVRATGTSVADTTRSLRTSAGRLADGAPAALKPPEPAGEDVVISTGDRPASLDGAARYPDLFAGPADDATPPEPPTPQAVEDDEPVAPAPKPRRARKAEPIEELRTHSEDFTLPDPSILRRSKEEQGKPDVREHELTASALVEALGHHGIDAQVVGTVSGPHITRYELKLADRKSVV